MPSTIYITSGSFDNLTVTGSLQVSAGITGSLQGTASFSQTASYIAGSITSASFASTASYWSGSISNVLSASFASTSSWVKNAETASYWSGSITNATSASFASTASFLLGSVTSASFASTASWVKNAQSASYWSGSITNALSASYAISASYAANGGNVSAFPYTGSAGISGSLRIKGSGSLIFQISGSQNSIFELGEDSTSSSIFTVSSGSINILNIVTGSKVIISGSLSVTSGITGSLLGTASYWSGSITNALSASYALTASYAANGGGGSGSSTTTTDNIFTISSNNLTANKTLYLLESGSSIVWWVTGSYNALINLVTSSNLVISGSQDGDYYTVLVKQDSTGSKQLLLPLLMTASLDPTPLSTTTLVSWYRSGSYEWRSSYVTASSGYLVLANNFTTSLTTTASTNLSFSIGINESYVCDIYGSCKKSGSATGLKFAIAAPAGCTLNGEQYTGGTTIALPITGSLITSPNTLGTTGATGNNVQVPFRLHFQVQSSTTPGKIIFQVATVTSNVAYVISGSRMKWNKSNLV